MDSVRFGRALGVGARLAAQTAARTLVTAADAAAAPNPTPASRSSARSSEATPQRPSSSPPPTAQRPPRTAAPTASTVRDTGRGLARGSRQFGQAVWGPVVKLSGVLWLELTGVFFGLFALSAGIAAWKLRDALHRTPANAEAHTHLLLALAVAAVFGYFCASSFLRANRRGRRP